MLQRILTLTEKVVALVKNPETEIFLIKLTVLIVLILDLAKLVLAEFAK